MKFLIALGIIFLLAILFGLIDISPLLAQISGPDGGIAPVPAEGVDMMCELLGFCK